MNDDNDENDDQEVDCNPFLNFDVDALLLDNEKNDGCDNEESYHDTSITNTKQKQIRHCRQWGIPTFHDQIDRGITSYTFENIITIQLKYREHSTGSDLWDSALVLSYAFIQKQFIQKYIINYYNNDNDSNINNDNDVDTIKGNNNNNQSSIFHNRVVLELGSGTGLVGLWISYLGAKKVILSDLLPNLELLQQNINSNNQLSNIVSVMEFDWTKSKDYDNNNNNIFHGNDNDNNDTDIDLIIGSDIFLPFNKSLLVDLAQTIIYLLLYCYPKAQVILCYEERFDCSLFFDYMKEHGHNIIEIEVIPDSLLHPIYQDPGHIKMIQIINKTKMKK